MAVVENETADGKPLAADNRTHIANWLSKQSFKGLEPEQEKDLQTWRKALLKLLKVADADDYSRGLESWDPLEAAMAVLVDFSVDGASAKASGYPHIAASIDTLMRVAKGIVLVQAEQDLDTLKKAREATRLFVEYVYIFNFLANAELRNPVAQAALLAVHPDEISPSGYKGVFLALHATMMPISRKHPKPGDQDIENGLIQLVLVLRTCKITDKEIREVGGDKLLGLTKTLRECRDLGK